MNQAPRSLLTHTRNYGPLSLTKSYFRHASMQVSSFILDSFRKFSKLFQKPQIQTKLADKELSNVAKEKVLGSEDLNQAYKGLRLCFQNTYEDANQQLEEKQIDVKNAQTRIDNQDHSPQLIDMDPQPTVLVEHKNQSQKSAQMAQRRNTKESTDQNQEDQFKGFMKGSKKVKFQQQAKITTEEAREVQIILNQTPESLKKLTEIHNQVIESIVCNQPEYSEKQHNFQQLRKQAQNSYQKMTEEPKKAAVKKFKEARKLMRELVSRQADFEKRFQLKLLQQRRRSKERMKIQLVSQLKLDMILPNFEKIVTGLRQEKLRKQQKDHFQTNKVVAESKYDKCQSQEKIIQQGIMQGQQSKQPNVITQAQQSLQNKLINTQLVIHHQKKQNSGQTTMPLAQQKQDKQLQYQQKKQEIIKNTDLEKPSNQPSLFTFKRQNLKEQISASLRKIGNLTKNEKTEPKQQSKQISNKIEQIPTLNKTKQVFQTPSKPTNPFAGVIHNKELNKKQNQSTLPQTEPTSQKINPFLTSTPSVKLRFDDIINKNPQFTIFNTKSPTLLPPPSSAAQVFKPDHNLPGNLFKNVCQQNYQQLQGSVQQHSNNFHFQNQQLPQPQNHNLMENRNFFLATPNPSTPSHLSPLQPNQTQLAYHSGTYADPDRLRNMFQPSQPVQQSGLFSGSSSNNSANRNHSRGHHGSNRHKKNKDIRIS